MVFFGNFIFNRVISESGFEFFDKIRTWLASALGFFFKNPYPTLFFIRTGKIRLIRVEPDRVSTDQI